MYSSTFLALRGGGWGSNSLEKALRNTWMAPKAWILLVWDFKCLPVSFVFTEIQWEYSSQWMLLIHGHYESDSRFVQLLGKAKGLGMSFRFSLFVNVFGKSTKKAVEVQQNFPEFVLWVGHICTYWQLERLPLDAFPGRPVPWAWSHLSVCWFAWSICLAGFRWQACPQLFLTWCRRSLSFICKVILSVMIYYYWSLPGLLLVICLVNMQVYGALTL